jgi:hypothetical protein
MVVNRKRNIRGIVGVLGSLQGLLSIAAFGVSALLMQTSSSGIASARSRGGYAGAAALGGISVGVAMIGIVSLSMSIGCVLLYRSVGRTSSVGPGGLAFIALNVVEWILIALLLNTIYS